MTSKSDYFCTSYQISGKNFSTLRKEENKLEKTRKDWFWEHVCVCVTVCFFFRLSSDCVICKKFIYLFYYYFLFFFALKNLEKVMCFVHTFVLFISEFLIYIYRYIFSYILRIQKWKEQMCVQNTSPSQGFLMQKK